SDVRGRVRARRATDRRLVDVNDLVQLLESSDTSVGARSLPGAVQAVGHRLVQNLVDERRFPRARYAAHAAQDAQRDLDVDLLQIVLGGALDLDVAGGTAPAARDLNHARPGQELPGQGLLHPLDLLGRALRHHVPAVLAG